MATQIERLAERPKHAAGVRLRQRPGDGVWLLEHNGRYVQLSHAALTIWQACDGERTWAQIAARYREAFGIDGTLAMVTLATMLEERGFFAAEAGDRTNVSQGPAVTATQAYVVWSLEGTINQLYALTRSAFAPFAVATFAALALAGAVLFAVTPHAMRVHGLGEQVAFALALIASVAIHEAGHALTLRHFGGTVRRAGFGWYWFTPVAFVDTSDAYTLSRGKRIAVTLAGPFASLIVAGCAGLLAAFSPERSVAAIASSLAAFTYVAMAWNLNPLLELDGYYVLADLLHRPNLCRDGFTALFGGRRDPVALAYALGALAYGTTVVFVTVPFVARMTIVAWLPATVGETIRMAIPMVATFAACIALAHAHRSVLLEAIRPSRSYSAQTFRTTRDA